MNIGQWIFFGSYFIHPRSSDCSTALLPRGPSSRPECFIWDL